MLIKSKASVYGRTNSVKNRIRASLRRKTLAKRFHSVPEDDGAGADSGGSGAAWWQQTSIDMGDADGDTNQGLKWWLSLIMNTNTSQFLNMCLFNSKILSDSINQN